MPRIKFWQLAHKNQVEKHEVNDERQWLFLWIKIISLIAVSYLTSML